MAEISRVAILSTADWSSPTWTNKQFVAREVAAIEGIDVRFIESLGLRAPRLNVRDLRRLTGRLSARFLRTRPALNRSHELTPSNLALVSPVVLPYHRFRLVRLINSLVLRGLRRDLKAWTQHHNSVFWCFNPIDYGLGGSFDFFVYHAVDLTHEYPGVPKNVYLTAEKTAVKKADVVIATSNAVASHLETLGARNVLLWENVADAAQISAQASYTRPVMRRAVFIGAIDSNKIDYPLVDRIATLEGLDGVDLIGPVASGDRATKDYLRALRNDRVRYLGPAQRADLGSILSQYALGIIPYRPTPYTAGVFPMKVYEYLAAGIAVACFGLKTVTFDEDVFDGSQVSNLQRAVMQALEPNYLPRSNDRARRQEKARAHSWLSRREDIRVLFNSL